MSVQQNKLHPRQMYATGTAIEKTFVDPETRMEKKYKGKITDFYCRIVEDLKQDGKGEAAAIGMGQSRFVYAVAYDDGDKEDMTEEEVRECCLSTNPERRLDKVGRKRKRRSVAKPKGSSMATK